MFSSSLRHCEHATPVVLLNGRALVERLQLDVELPLHAVAVTQVEAAGRVPADDQGACHRAGQSERPLRLRGGNPRSVGPHQTNRLKNWRARNDSNVRPSDS